MIPCLAMQKKHVPVICFAISVNVAHWNSGKSLQSSTWVVNATTEFSSYIKQIQIQELMKIF